MSCYPQGHPYEIQKQAQFVGLEEELIYRAILDYLRAEHPGHELGGLPLAFLRGAYDLREMSKKIAERLKP